MKRDKAPELDVVDKMKRHLEGVAGALKASELVNRQFDPTKDQADIQPSL